LHGHTNAPYRRGWHVSHPRHVRRASARAPAMLITWSTRQIRTWSTSKIGDRTPGDSCRLAGR
jgi:hypothetical protein